MYPYNAYCVIHGIILNRFSTLQNLDLSWTDRTLVLTTLLDMQLKNFTFSEYQSKLYSDETICGHVRSIAPKIENVNKSYGNRRGLVGSVLANWTKRQGSNLRPDIKTKYKKYFFGDLLSADFWQKLWE